MAERIGAAYTTDLSKLEESDAIILCVPAGTTSIIAKQAASFAKKGAILINCSTKAFFEDSLKHTYSSLYFVEAKIIGHAGSLEKGNPAFVVVDTDKREIFKVIADLFNEMGSIQMGDAKSVPSLSTMAAEAGIRTAVALRKQLTMYGLPEEMEDILIESVCAGTMSAYVRNDLGHFGQELAEKLESETGGD
ncbi:hypothetical protein [Bacillus sp. JCM 19041]|uniref:hypothetical protein n=1 Tax=Bacillus sp. JCM 19041 TaxID=1460637 RepID=UPI0006D20D31